MHVNKSLKLLKKINSVFHGLIDGTDSVSNLERELLKSYVIQFYDSLLQETTVASPTTIKTETTTPSASTGSLKTQEHRILEQTKEHVIVQPTTPQHVEPDDKEALEQAPNEEQPAAAHKEAEIVKDEDLLATLMASLDQKSSSHIGQRLVSDLNKSMGLNDKLRFANDLFGGQQSKLLETLEKINTSPDLNSIRDHMNEIAAEFQWTESKRQTSVSNFLYLIQRKFNQS